MNWKKRFKNKVFLTSFVAILLTFLYSLMELFGIIPSVDKVLWEDLLEVLLQILICVGVVINPTSEGVLDND